MVLRKLARAVAVLAGLLLVAVVGARLVVLHFVTKAFPPYAFPSERVEVRELQTAAPFGDCRITRDAGALLNPMIELDDGNHPAAAPPWWAAPEVTASLKAGGSTWLDHLGDGPRGDLSITAALLPYDGWDWMSSGHGAALLEGSGPGASASTVGIPNFVTIQTLAKLRLLEGLRSGDALPALREVRHLAQLLTCADDLVGYMVSVALLGIEADGYAAAVDREILAPDAWSPVPEDTRRQMKRLPWGLSMIYSGWAPGGSLARVEAVGGPIPGRCAALGQAVHMWTLHRELLGERWPLELDHTAPMRALDTTLVQSDCRLSLMRGYWSHPEWSAGAFHELAGNLSWVQTPYIRDIALLVLQPLSTPNDQYGSGATPP